MVWSSLAPKYPILVIFWEMDHQNSNFSLIYGTISDGGCWGRVRSKKFQKDGQAQISTTQEATEHQFL